MTNQHPKQKKEKDIRTLIKQIKLKIIIDVLSWIITFIIAVFIARLLTYSFGDWENYILLGSIFHLYFIKRDKKIE